MKLDLSNQIDQKRAESYLAKLIEKQARIEIKKFYAKRTLSQNAYFHVACTILSDYSGYTVDEMKIIIKDQLEFMTYTKHGHKFYVSSADLDKIKFMALVDYTRDFGDQNGCYIMTPEDWLENQFIIEKELKI